MKNMKCAIMNNLLLDAIWRKHWSKTFTIITGIASLLGLFVGWKIEGNPFNLVCSHWRILTEFICIVILFIMGRMIWLAAVQIKEYKFSKTASYTPEKMLDHLKGLIIEYDQFISHEIEKEKLIGDICNILKICASKTTNSQCSVSIKVIVDSKDSSSILTREGIIGKKVENLARDSDHGSRDTEDYKNTAHWISSNSAFSGTVGTFEDKKPKSFYLNNKIDPYNGYNTTTPFIDEEGLPYKSEMVFPIFRVLNKNCYDFQGFLCIDSEQEQAFSKNNSLMKAAEIATDILYIVLSDKNIDNGKK